MVRVGVIGVGYWGPNLVRTLTEIEGSRVVRVADLQTGRLEFIGRRFPQVQTTASAAEVIEDESIDAVFIATPPATHYKLASDALKAGKHVFIEKPFTTEVAQAEELVRTADATGKKIGVGHLFLYHPAVAAIAGLVAGGELGEPLYVCTSRFNVGPPQTRVDVLWDLAPHDVAIVLHLFGEPPVEVRASGARFRNDEFIEAACLNLTFPGGRMAQINVGWLTPAKVRNLMLVCGDKTVIYDDMQMVDKLRIYEPARDNRTSTAAASKALSYGPGNIVIPPVPSAEPLRLECEDFIKAIRSGAEPVSNGRNAIEVVRVLQAASRAIYSSLSADAQVVTA